MSEMQDWPTYTPINLPPHRLLAAAGTVVLGCLTPLIFLVSIILMSNQWCLAGILALIVTLVLHGIWRPGGDSETD